jgi:hypothetical protein
MIVAFSRVIYKLFLPLGAGDPSQKSKARNFLGKRFHYRMRGFSEAV